MSWESDDGLVPLRALANPLRIRMVSLLTGVSMSATEVAEELGIAHASASYHLRQLAEAGFLEMVEERPSQGGRGRPRRRYRYDPSSGARLDRANGRRLLHEALNADLERRLAQARTQRLSMDAEVWLDRSVWEEVIGLVDQAVALVHDKAGPPRSGDRVKVSMTTLLLELDDVR
ncbi:ArsR/SmtB family transcription factor [Nonomuraea jiangxiensis]|uniref:Helix-turn-helix domain-containing protein n=1 Tax=Nonomuraea jiangxiensis TaxID=633440 RepID=A0A1G8QSQ0_9ACTN|nr:helix-turn-helix domain-containing protein [Nonomuraea jiangxiensis]SDJ07643.1 Helix-turn-helix domain-containing protein [Nonomuraea jiangxiensis]